MEETLEKKRLRINAILDGAEKELQALGCPYFLAAIDRDSRDPDGGKVFVNSETKGNDTQVIFKHAYPSNKDIISLGLWVGNEIKRRNKDAAISFRDKKKTKKNDLKGVAVTTDKVVPERDTMAQDVCGECGGTHGLHVCDCAQHPDNIEYPGAGPNGETVVHDPNPRIICACHGCVKARALAGPRKPFNK